MSAANYRDLIKKVSAEFPGEYGPAPPDLIEAIINLESGGDPNATTGTATGLGQIMPTGLEYNAAVMDKRFTDKFGNAPNLYDPEQNLAVMAIGLTARHDAGVAQRLDDGYGAWADWYGATLGYFGAVGNESDPATGAAYTGIYTPADSMIANSDVNMNGAGYLNRIGEYVAFGQPDNGAAGWQRYTAIDKLGPGSFNPITNDYDHDALYTEMNDQSVWEWVADTGKRWAVKWRETTRETTDSVGNAVKSAIISIVQPLIDFAPRGGVIILGALLIVGAGLLWSL